LPYALFTLRFTPPLLSGRLLGRRKRFFADVELDTGERVIAHCPNSGAMTTCMAPGCRVWVLHCPSPHRKLDYAWKLSELGRARILVHSALCNQVVLEALRRRAIAPLSQYRRAFPEHAVDEHTRLDFLLESDDEQCLVEVKSVTLSRSGGRLAFPDARTTRGERHVRTLLAHRKEGRRAVLFFCAARSDARSVECAADIDPEYTRAVQHALAGGVEVLAYRVEVTRHGLTLGKSLPFLPP
jgi:sugar fermentation stimulation protein A